MLKKTAKPLRAKMTDGRQSDGDARPEMTDRDRDRFLDALDRPPNSLPTHERAARLHARATRGNRTTAMSDAPKIIIRLAKPTDVLSLSQLRYGFRAIHDPTYEAEADFLARCGDWMASHLASGSHWLCWMAEDAGSLVGAIWLQIIKKIPNPGAEAENHGYISNLYVEPYRRGSGLGSMLIDTCLRFCEKEAVDAVILWPTPRSRRLYERHGFAVREDLLKRRWGPTPPPNKRNVPNESPICLPLQNEVHQAMGVDAQHLPREHPGA